MSIDIYEYKSHLKGYEEEDEEWLIETDKRVVLIEVGGSKTPREITKELLSLGYENEDRVLVIIQ